MAKRVTWIASAVLLIAFGTIFYVGAARMLLTVYPELPVFLAVVVLVVAIGLRRRVSLIPRILMLSGSISLVLVYGHDWFLERGIEHQWFQVGGNGWVLYGYGEFRERPALATSADILRLLGFCFPVGLLLVALQRDDKPSNQAMQGAAR